MPLYEYQCGTCGHRFETIQKFSDPPVRQCPKCGGAVEKLIASPAFQFKGSGWYITDYAKKDKDKSDKSKEDGAGAGAGKAGEGTKDQPAGAATTKDAPKSETSSATPAASTDTAKKA